MNMNKVETLKHANTKLLNTYNELTNAIIALRDAGCDDLAQVLVERKGEVEETRDKVLDRLHLFQNMTYTTAPADYDYGWTRELKANAGTTSTGKVVRLVVCPNRYVEGQRARYQSGLHLAVSEEGWREHVKAGLVTESEGA